MAHAASVRVVTAADVAAAGDARALEWVRVAARALPLLGTVSKAKRARKSGELTLNGSALVPTSVAAAVGDEIAFAPRSSASGAAYTGSDRSVVPAETEGDAMEDARRWTAVCERQGLRRVFEDGEMALVVKPVGVHVKGRGQRTVERALLALLEPPSARRGDAALPSPHAVHRLDARVGGLLLVAKTRAAEVSLSAQLERHSVVKRYRAILAGSADGLASHPSVSLITPSSSSSSSSSSSNSSSGSDVESSVAVPAELAELARDSELLLVRGEVDGKPSLTALLVVAQTRSARYEWISTVDLWPLTGRRHQLRVHAARLGLPIVGDDLYHGHYFERSEAALPPVVRGLGLFLFAVAIAFNDGAADGGNRRRFEIDEPPKFARFRHFCALNWRKQQQRELRGAARGDKANQTN